MYASDTQFLTKRGWRKASQLQKLDHIANFGERGKIEWVSMEHSDIRQSSVETTIYDCKVGRTGKFAITKDHSIRFFHRTKHEDITLTMTLDEVMEKLEVQNFVRGFIPTTLNTALDKTEVTGNTAITLSKIFANIYKIDGKGAVHFSVSRKLSKKQIVDFLLKELNTNHENIKMSPSNTEVILHGRALTDWYEAIIQMPYLLARVVDDMLFREDSRSAAVRKLRFFCPNKAFLAQIAIAFTGRNTRYMKSEVYRNNCHLVVVEPRESSVSFRNKVIIIPKKSLVVTTAVSHPITRWSGSITSL